MAELTSNSGTTFIGDGGILGVQVNTNTNWEFYLTGDTGVPDWIHFDGNASRITGSESKIVTVEATKNTSGPRSASGICISTNEENLSAWTAFVQGTGSTGEPLYKFIININITSIISENRWKGLQFKSYVYDYRTHGYGQAGSTTVVIPSGASPSFYPHFETITVPASGSYTKEQIQDFYNNNYAIGIQISPTVEWVAGDKVIIDNNLPGTPLNPSRQYPNITEPGCFNNTIKSVPPPESFGPDGIITDIRIEKI